MAPKAVRVAWQHPEAMDHGSFTHPVANLSFHGSILCLFHSQVSETLLLPQLLSIQIHTLTTFCLSPPKLHNQTIDCYHSTLNIHTVSSSQTPIFVVSHLPMPSELFNQQAIGDTTLASLPKQTADPPFFPRPLHVPPSLSHPQTG